MLRIQRDLHPPDAGFQDGFSNPFSPAWRPWRSLAFGLASGLALGIIHVKLKVPSFIASLGFMSLWQSVALLITQNPESVPKALWGTVEWYKIAFGVVGCPDCGNRHYPVHPLCYPLHPQRTDHFAIGGNERTARVAGMGVDRTRFWYLPSTAHAGRSGRYLPGGQPPLQRPTGDPFTLKIVAACALGGHLAGRRQGQRAGHHPGRVYVAIIETA